MDLEQRPDDNDLLNAIFRGFHTVKGGAGFLQLTALVDCCHVTENLFDILPFVDLILLMSVNPGFGGQKFIETTFDRAARLRKMVDAVRPEILIEVDGGVNDQNAGQLFESGADILVAGSFVFKSDDPAETIANLKRA